MKGTMNTWLTSYSETFKLSPREGEVLRLAVEGLQNKEISHAVGCADSTIISYWKRIFSKTYTKTRNQVLSSIIRFQAQLHLECVYCPIANQPLYGDGPMPFSATTGETDRRHAPSNDEPGFLKDFAPRMLG